VLLSLLTSIIMRF